MADSNTFSERLAIVKTNRKTSGIVDMLLGEQKQETSKGAAITMLPIDKVHPLSSFPHPYNKSMTEGIDELARQIESVGVLQPVIVRPLGNESYEILVGHRRHLASLKAGIKHLPAIVMEVDDNMAKIIVNDNLSHRQFIYPSEKAQAYDMLIHALKRQGKSRDIIAEYEEFLKIESKVLPIKLKENSVRGVIAAQEGISFRQISYYVRLLKLIPELLEMVDQSVKEGSMVSVRVGVELSFLTKEQQVYVLDYLNRTKAGLTVDQAAELRDAVKTEGLMDETMIGQVLGSVSRNGSKIEKKHQKIYKKIFSRMSRSFTDDVIVKIEKEPERFQTVLQDAVIRFLKE